MLGIEINMILTILLVTEIAVDIHSVAFQQETVRGSHVHQLLVCVGTNMSTN